MEPAARDDASWCAAADRLRRHDGPRLWPVQYKLRAPRRLDAHTLSHSHCLSTPPPARRRPDPSPAKMKFFAAAALFLGAAMAVPTTNPSYVACSPLFGQEQCCATDVLGIADLNCASRASRLGVSCSSLPTALTCRRSQPLSQQQRRFQGYLRRSGPARPLLRPALGECRARDSGRGCVADAHFAAARPGTRLQNAHGHHGLNSALGV